MNERTPRSVQEYLVALSKALRDEDPALRQDALYDAEEYLRAELAAQPGRPESEVLAAIVGSYGSPEEVAEVYRQTEQTVARALHTPAPAAHRTLVGRFFGVFADPHAWLSTFYMMLALAIGIFAFTWTVTGLSVSLATSILIFGLPLFLLFLGSTRLFALLEGRIVETLLGVRMPRRPRPRPGESGLLASIGAMLKDVRTWSTLLYMLLMLPLGVAYFTIAVTLISISAAAIASPFAWIFDQPSIVQVGDYWFDGPVTLLLAVAGFLLLTVSMHLFRGIGYFHGHIARGLLVKPGA